MHGVRRAHPEDPRRRVRADDGRAQPHRRTRREPVLDDGDAGAVEGPQVGRARGAVRPREDQRGERDAAGLRRARVRAAGDPGLRRGGGRGAGDLLDGRHGPDAPCARGEDARGADAAPGRSADAAGGKERNQIIACRSG